MTDVIKNLRTFWFVFALYMRQSLYHKSGAIAVIASWGLRLALTMVLYHSIFKLIGQTAIRNTSYDVAVSGMLFFTLFSIFGIRDLNRIISREYKAGSLEIWFTKPLPYVLLKLAEVLGKSIPSLIGVVVIIAGYWLVAHDDFAVDHMVLRLVLSGVFLLGGLVIAICLYSMVGLSAIFLTDSKAVWFIIDKLVMIFGGIYIPIGFFPGWFRMIGETLPTGALMVGGQFLYPDFFSNLPRFIVLQSVWLCLLVYGLLVMNRQVEKHLTVNGG